MLPQHHYIRGKLLLFLLSQPVSKGQRYFLHFSFWPLIALRWKTKRSVLPFLFCELDGSVQSLSHVQLFETPWTAAHQASLSFTNSWSLLKLMSIESMMPYNLLILCHSLLPPSIFPSIRVFSNESVLQIKWPKYWSYSFSISLSSEYSVMISFRMDWSMSLRW